MDSGAWGTLDTAQSAAGGPLAGEAPSFSPTRGGGLLEQALSARRARLANDRIADSARRGVALDMGCGAHPFFLLGTNFRQKVGVDRRQGTTWSQSLGAGLHMAVCDLEQGGALPFRNDCFHVITMLAVLEHIAADRVAFLLGEAYRVLRPAGRLILTTPPPWTNRLLPLLAKFGLVSQDEIEEHESAYTAADLRLLLRMSGFESSVNAGYFECYMNTWATADKVDL